MADQIRVNGNQLSWGSIIVKINEERYYGFKSLSYGDSRERVKTYGMGRHHSPRGRTRGKYSTDPVTLGGPKSSVQALIDALAAAGDGTNAGDTVFQIVAQYVEDDETPITVEIEDCVLTKISSSEEESADPLEDEIESDCMRIRRNGKTLFDSSDA